MKFTYVDESGDRGQSDVFVMAGVLIDAYRIRKYTVRFDEIIPAFLAKHPKVQQELKTKAFINGTGGWSQVDAVERKHFLGEVCDLAAECARIFAIAFSFDKFHKATNANYKQTFGNSYWLGAAMFVAALVQKKMQTESKNKGLTVLIFDDNKMEMQNLSNSLYKADAWFDPIYQTSRKNKRNGKAVWISVTADERFDNIVNCAFAIKSHHSSFIQVADAVSYVYRRDLELRSEKEEWDGERTYFAALVGKLESKRERLNRNPGGSCVEFYNAARHDEWRL